MGWVGGFRALRSRPRRRGEAGGGGGGGVGSRVNLRGCETPAGRWGEEQAAGDEAAAVVVAATREGRPRRRDRPAAGDAREEVRWPVTRGQQWQRGGGSAAGEERG
uniref:Uncharacterized protein n=1 Tax=Oryza rufipogon TaxID=4529 RepID=A0A0E0QJ11_ORYRU